MIRKCKKCNIEKSINDFTPNKNCKYGKEHECLVCSVKRRVKWEYNNQDKRQNTYFKHHYGITKACYDEMFTKQNGVCHICNNIEKDSSKRGYRPKQLAVDHCHKTDKVRGLLCRTCNTSLGGFKDDISILKAAISYLNKYK